MIITKKEARKRNRQFSRVCLFHVKNPDQEGSYHCKDCVIIQDPCGCDEDMECESCK